MPVTNQQLDALHCIDDFVTRALLHPGLFDPRGVSFQKAKRAWALLFKSHPSAMHLTPDQFEQALPHALGIGSQSTGAGAGKVTFMTQWRQKASGQLPAVQRVGAAPSLRSSAAFCDGSVSVARTFDMYSKLIQAQNDMKKGIIANFKV